MGKLGVSSVGRRRALQLIGAGGVSASGLLVIGCGGGGEKKGGDKKPAGGKEASKKPEEKSCDTAIDAASKKKRKTFVYKEVAADPKKPCNECAQWVEGQYGECGGCKLFTGPIQAKGGCTAWAAKEAAG